MAAPKVRNRPPTPAKHPFQLPPKGVLPTYMARAQEMLANPFVGITTDGKPVPGLFSLRKTGISVQPIIDATGRFLATLNPEQRKAATFGIDDKAWQLWCNVHPYLVRHGVCLDDMNDDQKGAALGMVRASLSAAGYETARDVMKLNETIREITGRDGEYGEWMYWMSVFGTPASKEPWGWQIDGHHLIINCFVLGDQIVMTPNFMGSEPVYAESGKYAGTRVFHNEEAGGFALMKSLSPEQQARATIGNELPFDAFTTAFRDNLQLKYEGIRYDELADDQRALLMRLIELYVGRIRPGHAEIRLEEVKAHLDQTYFAWIGPVNEVSPFYYRIHSPVILIEFDHQTGIAFDNDEHTRNHIHTLVRTPNGNDYGKDLLRQHYEQFDHSHPHTPHRLGKI
jgi:hypothetical protein